MLNESQNFDVAFDRLMEIEAQYLEEQEMEIETNLDEDEEMPMALDGEMPPDTEF